MSLGLNFATFRMVETPRAFRQLDGCGGHDLVHPVDVSALRRVQAQRLGHGIVLDDDPVCVRPPRQIGPNAMLGGSIGPRYRLHDDRDCS